jgi:hypothetical protein
MALIFVMEKHCAAGQLEINVFIIYYLILFPVACSSTPFPTTLACSFSKLASARL